MLVFIAVIKKWTEKFMARICNGFSYEIKERDLHKKCRLCKSLLNMTMIPAMNFTKDCKVLTF